MRIGIRSLPGLVILDIPLTGQLDMMPNPHMIYLAIEGMRVMHAAERKREHWRLGSFDVSFLSSMTHFFRLRA